MSRIAVQLIMAILIYLWSFGDNYRSNEEFPEHNWLREGTYTVTLVVWTEFGSVTVTDTVVVTVNSISTPPPSANRDLHPFVAIGVFCLRYAVEPSQGIGWAEVDGDDWPEPVPNYGALLIIDDNETPRMLLEDRNDDWIWEDATFDRVQWQKPTFVDKFYSDSLRNGDYRWVLSAAGANEYYVEKLDGGDPDLLQPKILEIGTMDTPEGTVGTLQPGYWAWGDNDVLGFDTVYVRLPDNTDPDTKNLGYVMGYWWTEITPEEWYQEEVSNSSGSEDDFEVPVQHFFTRPYEPENKGKAGYDANGYRTAQRFDLDVYKDGDLTRPFKSVVNTPDNGDIMFSGTVIEAKRIMPVFKCAASEIMVVGRNMTKIIKPKQESRELRRTDSWAAEAALAAKRFHIGRNLLNPLLERVSGNTVAGSVGQTIGPDGNDGSAIILTANLNLTNNAVTGAYTFVFWRTILAPIVTIPALAGLNQQGDTYNDWQLMYVVGNNCPANLVITPGTASEIVIYAGDITEWLSMYYTDMRYGEDPRQFLCGF